MGRKKRIERINEEEDREEDSALIFQELEELVNKADNKGDEELRVLFHSEIIKDQINNQDQEELKSNYSISQLEYKVYKNGVQN